MQLGAVLATALNVRTGAGRNHRALDTRLICGDIVELLAEDGDWYQVRLPAAKLEGWSHGAFIVKVAPGRGNVPSCDDEKPDDHKLANPPPGSKIAGPARQKRVAQETPTPAPEPEEKPSAGQSDPKTGPSEKQAALPGPAKRQKAPPKLVTLAGKSHLAQSVPFPHAQHVQANLKCTNCHHPAGHSGTAANEEKRCHECHKQGSQSPIVPKLAFHKTCRPCHEAQGAGPTQCENCHTGK